MSRIPAGSIVTTLSGGDSFVGNNGIEVNEDEIFYLTVTSTTMGSGTTVADATVVVTMTATVIAAVTVTTSPQTSLAVRSSRSRKTSSQATS